MAFFPHHHHQKQPQTPQQQQPPIPFRNFVPIEVANVGGIAPGSAAAAAAADGGSNGWEPRRKRPKEQELLENSQVSSMDFLQTGSVSTGLGLSLDDRRAAAAAAAAASSGESPSLLLLPLIDEDIDKEVQRMDAEMDRFIKIEPVPSPDKGGGLC